MHLNGTLGLPDTFALSAFAPSASPGWADCPERPIELIVPWVSGGVRGGHADAR